MSTVRRSPCSNCPYRRDVPSGIWAFEEYERLRDYDRETASQPTAAFGCHSTPDKYCHGWAVVHSSRGHAYELLALRLRQVEVTCRAAMPLFGSGGEAADHGQVEIEAPGLRARRMINRLVDLRLTGRSAAR
jgi:hypothetical protein